MVWRIFLAMMVVAQEGDIAASAGSPYDLVRFVRTHDRFEWAPLWRVLKIDNGGLPVWACEGGCTAELTTIEQPPQAIVALNGDDWRSQVYLRYRKAGPNNWRFAGSWSPFLKYFKPAHRIVRKAGQLYLVAEEQGGAGTGLSSKVENWFDLSREDLTPVLRFTVEGDRGVLGTHVGHEVRGSIAAFSADRIDVGFRVRFQTSRDGDPIFAVGSRRDTAVYVRSSSGEFKFDPKSSTLTGAQLTEFYDLSNPDFRPEAFLKFNIESLRKIAADRVDRAHGWLAGYLDDCPDGPEKRELTALLRRR